MRFYRTRRYNSTVMRIARYSLVAIVSVALSVGLVYSQLCSTVCSFYGCSPFESSEVTECSQHNKARRHAGEAASHHGQGVTTPTPQEQNRSHDCAVHTDPTTTFSTKSTITLLHRHTPQVVTGVPSILNISPFNLATDAQARAHDRSPPKGASVSILRI